MNSEKYYLAVDLGAESGRVIGAAVTEEKIILEEIHRFQNGPTEENGSLKWDFNNLFAEIKQGLKKAISQMGGKIAGIGVDTWGVDFGYIDHEGILIENPYHYRDARNAEAMEEVFQIIPRKQLYHMTGIQFLQFNTLFQLYAAKKANSQAYQNAKHIIWMADLISYHLCGSVFAEYTLASTGQVLNMQTGTWAREAFQSLDLRMDLLPELIHPGNIVGHLKPELAEEFQCEPIPVIAVGSHDTASAVAAVPATGQNWAYLSSGTWSLMGVETPNAVINEQTFDHQFTNEGGVCNNIRLLKNIMGLWLVQECRRQWQREGQDLNYDQITAMAKKAPAFAGILNTNDTSFMSPGDMPKRINACLVKTGYQSTSDKGTMIRLILESLALNYRWGIETLEKMRGASIDILHIVGGGIQNELLCQFASDAIGKPVVTGPIEATASGNIMMQAIAAGQVDSLTKAREIVSRSFEMKRYEPKDSSLWQQPYQIFLKHYTP